MPIKIPDDLPARAVLEEDGIEIIRSHDAVHQDIRPLRVLLLNLMPKKVETEIHLARLLSHTPLQLELTLLTTSTYTPTNTSQDHLKAFYKTLDEVRDETFDGLVVTGAPVERIAFEDVDYWQELCGIFDWARDHVTRTLNICWGAQAALHHEFGIPKFELPAKASGIFEQTVVAPRSQILRGFPACFPMAVSRYTGTRREDVEHHPDLEILIESDKTGIAVIEHKKRGDLYIFNHFEYEADTLRLEYERDIVAEDHIDVPANYFPGDDPRAAPVNTWRPYGYLIFGNWLSALYRDTPFDLDDIGKRP